MLSREELQEVLKKAYEYARKQAKESGASMYYIKNDKRIREDTNGNQFELIYNADRKRREIEYHE